MALVRGAGANTRKFNVPKNLSPCVNSVVTKNDGALWTDSVIFANFQIQPIYLSAEISFYLRLESLQLSLITLSPELLTIIDADARSGRAERTRVAPRRPPPVNTGLVYASRFFFSLVFLAWIRGKRSIYGIISVGTTAKCRSALDHFPRHPRTLERNREG
ncbi:hypothetical protein EVAR_24521_1 [Eumeta japonica]|uniref:Uncharacterized protein n=1 Tax=Eumeta variegata TaxID=151549 RepID=A0A4C1UQX8_EUMVA|nr:hypothetical protein EVAR_24521_1 [Eumeta japonica]